MLRAGERQGQGVLAAASEAVEETPKKTGNCVGTAEEERRDDDEQHNSEQGFHM